MSTRREILLLISAFALAPRALPAQEKPPAGGLRRVGVLLGYAEDDPEAQARLAAFKERLATLGWVEGRNLQFDLRWATADVGRASILARKMVALRPDVILSNTTPVTAALQKETRTIPIVFTAVSDPVGSGFVKALARPGGNITGFINLESSLVEKWVQFLKEAVPRMKRAVVIFNPDTAPYAEYYLQPLRAVAPKLGVTAATAGVRSEADLQRTIGALGHEPGSGLIVMTDSFMTVHRKSIIALAARYRVPTMYFVAAMATEGGLISYGVDYVELFRRAAPYVDRILRGARPADLPVEQPSKFEMVINLKTAKVLGIAIPQAMLVRADRVIE